ncbi:MAG: flagellar hook-basal body complex protein FliE [Acidimicrobiales bacterium]
MAVIPPISSGIAPITSAPAPTSTGTPAIGGNFLDGLKEALDSTGEANALAQDLATGNLSDIHRFTATSAKAGLALELTVAVRDRALSAYQEVMRMQL